MRQGKLKLKSSTINETEVKSIQEEMCVGEKDGFAACGKSQTVRRPTRKNGQINQIIPNSKIDPPQVTSSSNEDSDLDDSSSDTTSSQDKKRYKCKVCGAVFQRPWRLATHRRIHTNQKPFKCDSEGCLKAYAYSHHLDRHKSRSHSDLVVVGKIPCSAPGCHMLFSSALNVLKHYKRFHDSAAFGFACPECDSKFRKHRQLRLHMILHTGEAPFKCKVCDQGFTTLCLLNRHLRGHKEYKCDIPGCDLKLPNVSAFRKHQAEHNACFTTMQCAHCSKVFKSKAALRAHVRTHIGEASVFKCTYGNCERVYYQKRNLTQHVRLRHEKISNFKCSQEGCERVFATQKKLDIHTNWHINGPAPPRPRTEPRKQRKDAGTRKRSFAAKLAGVVVPYSVEKELLKRKSTSALVYSDEDNSESDNKSECEQPGAKQELQGDQCESCPDVNVQPDCDQGLERSEGIVILDCVAVESQETLELISTNVSEVCASSKDTILVSQQDGVGSSETLGSRASATENGPFDESHNQSCSESSESAVPVISCLEKVERSKSDLIVHITSPQETVLAQQAEKDNGMSDAPRESGSTAVDESEHTPTTPDHCANNSAQVLLVIYENPGGEGIDSNSIYINPDTIVEFADDPLPLSSPLGDFSMGKAEDLSVAVVPNNNLDSAPDESPCCQTKDDVRVNKLNITVSNTSDVSEMKSTCEELLNSNKFDGRHPDLDKMKKISAEHAIEDVAVHQLTRLLHSISSNVAARHSPPKVKIASSKITEKFSSDCVMDLPGPVRGHADDQEDSDSAEEDQDEAHDENSDSDRDDDFLHQDDNAEEEHAGGEGNGEDEDDGDDDNDDDDENDNENHDDDEVEGDGDEDDDENDNDDNHGAQEPNDGNDDNNNSNDSNCDSSSDGNRTIGGQTDSESSNDSHSFGDGSDMGVDRALPPLTNQDMHVAEVTEKLSSEDEEVDVENITDCEIPVERRAQNPSEEKKQSVKFTADPSPRKNSARVQRLESRKRIATITEVSEDEEEMVEASEQAVIEATTNGKKSEPITQSSNRPIKKKKKQEEKSPVGNIPFGKSVMKEVSTQQDITVRTQQKRSCSDELPPPKKFLKITESVRICGTRSQAKDSDMAVRISSRRPQAEDLFKDGRMCSISPLTKDSRKDERICSKSPLIKDSEKSEKNEQSQRKACSELTEELWLNILRQTKDLWKLNEPLLSKNKIK